jgi:hypothetical protein
MLAVGVVALVGFLVAAVALWNASGQRRADNVAGFARAPVGCDTTLDFEATGTFVVFVETTGSFDAIAGACDAELQYDRDADDIPDPELTLTDPDGNNVSFDDAGDVSYDVDGFVGSSTRTVQIDTPGDHILTVAPTSGDSFAVAVGRSPDDGVALLRWGAIAAAIAGLVVGGAFLVLGSRRVPVSPAAAPTWAPDGEAWPSAPPGFPVPPPTTGAIGPAGPSWAPVPTQPPTASPHATPPTTGMPGGEPPSPWGPPPSQQ